MFKNLKLILLSTIPFAMGFNSIKSEESIAFYPNKSGVATVTIQDKQATVENKVIKVDWKLTDGLTLASINNLYTKQTRQLNIPLFSLHYTLNGKAITLGSQDCRVKSTQVTPLVANPKASVLANQLAGQKVEILLESENIDINVSLIIHKDSNYLRQICSFTPKKEIRVDRLDFFPGVTKQWKSVGVSRGAPMINEHTFISAEHPSSLRSKNGQTIKCGFTLTSGKEWRETSVIGVTAEGQLRRGFLHYIERERAAPYHVFQHYNNWTVTTYVKRPYNEATVRNTIENWGKKLIEPYGVKIDTFALDDGWDDYDNSLWEFHKGRFPNGFKPLKGLLDKYNSSIGIWLSPFGGYAHARYARERYARKVGLLKPGRHLSLADKPYYDHFLKQISKIQIEENVNYLKIDRLGGVNELNAAKKVFEELRKIRPDVFINLTRDSWPSPFWLRIADSLWRGGEDSPLYKKAPGSNTQKWIAYRDGIVYRNIVKKAPLYPITSLMVHGLIYSTIGPPKHFMKQDLNDFYDQAHSFVASGINCQELYIDYKLMTEERWAFLAKVLKWGRANQHVMADNHWVGGDPFKIEPYGWAGWSVDKSIVTLRNPSDKVKTFTFNPRKVFELPTNVKGQMVFKKLWSEDTFKCGSDETITITLQPLKTVTWESI